MVRKVKERKVERTLRWFICGKIVKDWQNFADWWWSVLSFWCINLNCDTRVELVLQWLQHHYLYLLQFNAAINDQGPPASDNHIFSGSLSTQLERMYGILSITILSKVLRFIYCISSTDIDWLSIVCQDCPVEDGAVTLHSDSLCSIVWQYHLSSRQKSSLATLRIARREIS